MKTAMTEVLNLVEQMFYTADALKLESQASMLNDIINIITQEGIPKEKEQILAAYNNGSQDMSLEEKYEPLDYYNQTYNENK